MSRGRLWESGSTAGGMPEGTFAQLKSSLVMWWPYAAWFDKTWDCWLLSGMSPILAGHYH